MGGAGSTRWSGHDPGPTTEGALGLQVRHFRGALATPEATRGRALWPAAITRRGGAPLGAIGWAISAGGPGAPRQLTLSYGLATDGIVSKRVRESVLLEPAPMRLGGSRWWIRCPGCVSRRAALYLEPTAGLFRCRGCAGLRYPTQQLGPLDRSTAAVVKAAGRLGYTGDPEGGRPRRPHGMHRRTHRRLLAALAAAEAARDEAWAEQLLRRLVRFAPP